MSIKVLHVFYGNDIAGGGSYSMLYLCEGLHQSDGCEVQAIVPATPKRVMSNLLNEKGIKTYDYKVPWIVHWNGRKARIKAVAQRFANPVLEKQINESIRNILVSESIDIVHIGGAVIDVGFAPAIDLGIPVVWHFREFVERDHGLIYFDKERAFDEYAQASHCIAVSNSVADYYRKLLPSTPVAAIYNGMLPKADISRLRSNYTLNTAPNGKWRLAFFGGVRETKGTFELLEGLAELDKQAKPCFHLDIYGLASGNDLEYLQSVITKYKLAGRVEYKGWAKVDSALLSSYDIVFTCSKAEAFGRVTADAMCNGVLVIGANTGGTRELLSEGRGVLYESGDAESLARSIDGVISGRFDYGNIVNRAFEFAEANFSFEAYVSNVMGVYKRTLDLIGTN